MATKHKYCKDHTSNHGIQIYLLLIYFLKILSVCLLRIQLLFQGLSLVVIVLDFSSVGCFLSLCCLVVAGLCCLVIGCLWTADVALTTGKVYQILPPPRMWEAGHGNWVASSFSVVEENWAGCVFKLDCLVYEWWYGYIVTWGTGDYCLV